MYNSELFSKQMDELIKAIQQPPLLSNLSFWNLIILAITLGFLIWYTIETSRMSAQAKHTNLRPVILRTGFIQSWETIGCEIKKAKPKGDLLELLVLKNIATSISGYIVINGIKFELLFGNKITQTEKELKLLPKWGWMKADCVIYAGFVGTNGQSVKEATQIVIQYQDIEGNHYYTVESEHFDQKSYAGRKPKQPTRGSKVV